MAKSYVNVDPNFNARTAELQEHHRQAGEALLQGERGTWYRPASLTGLNTPDDAAAPFQRTQANQECLAALSDPQVPGTTGDVIAATTQIDYLAVMGRAFLARHTANPVRLRAHLAGRHFGQGLPSGPIAVNVRQYVTELLAEAKIA